jgi:hypothetical protein
LRGRLAAADTQFLFRLGNTEMPERLDFEALWPVPPGRFGWTARGNAPCLMEIVSWLTTGEIDIAWPGVSPAIAEYIQAAQDALDDEARQKLLVLVPGLIGCAREDDPPEIELSRGVLLAQRSVSLLVSLALEAGAWFEQAEAVRASAGTFEQMRGPLREAAEYARPNPLVTKVISRALKVVATADNEKPFQRALLPVRAGELAVSVIQCNDAPARKLLLGDRPRMRLLDYLEQAIITIIEEAIGLVEKPPPFDDPWEVLDAGERFKTALAHGFAPAEISETAACEPREPRAAYLGAPDFLR